MGGQEQSSLWQLLAGVKPVIRQTIKARINEDNKNTAELWTAIETEYRIYAADTRMKLMYKFSEAAIEDNNIQQYIFQFRDICSRLKQIRFEIPQWQQNNRFIDGLKGHQSAFIWAKRDEIRDPKNKGNIMELNLNELMDQLIARTIDYKDNRSKPAKALKAEIKSDEELDDAKPKSGSLPSRQLSTRGSRRGRGEHHQHDNNQQG